MGLFSKNKTRDFYFQAAEKNKVAKLIQNGPCADLAKVVFSDYGHRLRVIFTKDRQNVTLQVFEYVPHQYVAFTEPCVYAGAAAEGFCKALKL